MFLSGAERNKGGIHRDLSAARAQQRRPRLRHRLRRVHGRIFVSASIAAADGVACAIAAYVDIMRHRDRTAATLGVAMGQQYPAQPPYGGYGAKNLEGRQREPHDVGIPPACACVCFSVAMCRHCFTINCVPLYYVIVYFAN
nr:hypothetical protein SEVIR_1G230800v2 [Setaria viridis]